MPYWLPMPKWYQGTKTHVDTWTLAKELEALLLEYE